MHKKIAITLGVVSTLLVAYLLFWPVPIDPVAWTAPVAPVVAQNTLLAATERLAPGFGHAPEDVAFDAEGRIYGSCSDGRIIRLAPDGSNPSVFANTGGRPAGLRFDRTGNLIVADCARGLLSISPGGEIRTLATTAGGVPFKFTDDVDIAADGTIYFTDATSKFDIQHFVLDALEHRPNGRFLAYDPATGATRVLLDDLYFANGVAVAPDQSYVLVCETNAYRIRRYWLTGDKAGTSDIWVDNLPGFPDGVLSNGRGTYWVALASPRDNYVDMLLRHPFLRKILARLPSSTLPGPKPYGWLLGLDESGKVVADMQDPSGRAFSNVTNVVEHDGRLYLGSLSETGIGRVPSPLGGAPVE